MATDDPPGEPRGGSGARSRASRVLYDAACKGVALVLAVFFEKVEQVGAERLEAGRPVVLAANHPNEMLDPFLIGHFHPGRVNFLAKSTLFGFAPFGWLLRALGVIPLFRPRDVGSDTSRNDESFRECFSALEAGEAVGIFPEGTSHSGPSLLPLKTGAARIALAVEERNGYALGLRIVPVGLYFTRRDEFRSGALAVFGEPLEVARHFETYRTDPQAAVRALTEELEQRLRGLTLNLRVKEEEALIDQVQKLFRHELPELAPREGPAGDFELARAIADGYHQALERQPERIRQLQQRVGTYFRLIRRSRLRPGAAGVSTAAALRYLARLLPAAVLGLPVALFGLATSWLPYRIPGWYSQWAELLEEERATFKVAVGAASFGVCWVSETAAVWAWLGPWAALGFLAALVPSALFALGYWEAARVFLLDLRSFLVFLTDLNFTRRLRSMREQLCSELRRLADERASNL